MFFSADSHLHHILPASTKIRQKIRISSNLQDIKLREMAVLHKMCK